jgi:ABC-type polysaccharide/polyol phosphate transport system ATPase subunit
MSIVLRDVRKEFVRQGRGHRPLYRDLIRTARGIPAGLRTVALDGVTAEIPPGARVALVGANGTGKSTLLRVIAGIQQPTAGSVRVDGRVACFFEVGVGAVPTLMLEDNIRLYGALVGLTRREVETGIDEILEFAELDTHRGHRIEQLSFGMAQRLFFAVMAHTMKLAKADVYLLDEWFAGVDQRFKEKGEEMMRRVSLGDRIVVYASHDLDLLAHLCTTALYLRDGRVRLFGDTAAVLEQYRRDARESP